MAITPFTVASLVEVKAAIKDLQGGDDEDDRLTLLINGVTSLFELETNRKLLSRTYRPSGAGANEEALLLNGDDRLSSSHFLLPQYPVSSVSAITVKQRDLLAPNQTVLTAGEDWTVEAETGILTLIDGDVFPLGRNNIEITWVAGIAAANLKFESLRTATIEQVREYWSRENRAQDGVSSLSDGGGSVTYFTGALLPSVRFALDQFKSKVLA